MNKVELTERIRGRVGERVPYVNARTLYIVSVKIDINIQKKRGQAMNDYFIITDQQDYREY